MGLLSKLFGRKGRTLSRVRITSSNGNLDFDISTPHNGNLIILLASYFTKVRWLLETEPELPMKRMKDYYDEVLSSYPNIRNYTIYSLRHLEKLKCLTSRQVEQEKIV